MGNPGYLIRILNPYFMVYCNPHIIPLCPPKQLVFVFIAHLTPNVKPAAWQPNFFCGLNPSKIEWDLTNGPLRKLLELLDAQV